jgi:hypothetical protein
MNLVESSSYSDYHHLKKTKKKINKNSQKTPKTARNAITLTLMILTKKFIAYSYLIIITIDLFAGSNDNFLFVHLRPGYLRCLTSYTCWLRANASFKVV